MKCASCNLYFAGDAEMEKHFADTHRDYLICEQCKKTFSDQKRMHNHMKKSHVDKSKKVMHICTKCGKTHREKLRSFVTDLIHAFQERVL